MDWGQLNEVNDWNDLSKMMEDEDNSSTKDQSNKNLPTGQQKKKDDAGQADKPAKNPISDLDKIPISGWNDMKQFNDDHDPGWFEEEEKRLASIYGGHFIKVKYTEQGRPGYFCELCMSEMNAKKSLESHCEGMKHLKKKALWEKNKAENRDNRSSDVHQGGWSDGPSRNYSDRDRSPFRSTQDHSRSPGYRGRGLGYTGPPRKKMAPRNQSVLPTGPASQYGRGGRSDSGEFYGRPNHHPNGPPPGCSGWFDGHPAGGYDRPGQYNNKPGGQFENPNNRFDGPCRPPPIDQRSSTEETSVTPVTVPTEKLSGGTTGLLLTKLASCYIKDEADADLALSVVSALASSLREYNTMLGEKKIVELLTEAELKLNTLKAVKVGLKLLNNKQIPGSSAAAAAAAAAAAPGVAAQFIPDGRPPHMATAGRQGQPGTEPPRGSAPVQNLRPSLTSSERRSGWPRVASRLPPQFPSPAYTAQGTPYPPNYPRH
ncbi:Zinc finger C2H2-type [Trinorchestia longiramus]|nr:Zinc finger C2H2-type [Trinorchestia longiramus]